MVDLLERQKNGSRAFVGRGGESVTVISAPRGIGGVAGNVEDSALDGHIGGI